MAGRVLKEVPLVFVPGLKGSRLVDKDGSVCWLGAAQTLNPFNRTTITLPLDHSQGAQAGDGLRAEGVLVADMLGMAEVAYKDITEVCRQLGRAYYEFSFDWRRDLGEAVGQLALFLTKVGQGQPVQVLAHSTGGLVAFALLNRHPHLFHSLLLAGTPFNPSVAYLNDLTSGSKSSRGSALLSAAAHFSWPAMFSLLPAWAPTQWVMDLMGNHLDIDLLDVDDWVTHHIGVFCRDITANPPSPAEIDHLHRALDAARNFREEIVCAAIQYPPIAVLAGSGTPTPVHCIKRVAGGRVWYNFDDGLVEDGDGRVCVTGTLPPSGVPYRLHRAHAGHGGLLLNTERVVGILSELGGWVEERRREATSRIDLV